MADWKDDRNLGPWAFVKQPNKWGYLNNPRWRNPARAFQAGGADDYNGRESEEPQIWTPQAIGYSRNAQTRHHQCGHWHTPVTVPVPGGGLYVQQNAPVTFTVFGGSVNVLAYAGNCFYPHPSSWPPTSSLTSMEGELWYSDDGGVTYHAVAGTAFSFTLADPFPWAFSVAVNPVLWQVAGRTLYVHYRAAGGAWVTSQTAFYWDPTQVYSYGRFWTETVNYPYSYDNSIFIMRWQVGKYLSDIAEPLDAALFDRQTGLMIPGSEIHFATEELRSEKYVVLTDGTFPFTHEVELRAKSDATDRIHAPYLQEASLFVDYENITAFTSYQIVGRGSLNWGWGYAGVYDLSPYPWNGQEQYMWPDPAQPDLWTPAHPPDDGFPGGYYRYGGVDAGARQMLRKFDGMEIRYQACIDSYADDTTWPFDPNNPGLAYEYNALWDNELNDLSYSSGAKRVDLSKVNFLASDLNEWQKRTLKTSEDIASVLVDGNRYCQLQPDDYAYMWWMFPMNAQLLCTVRGDGSPLNLPDTFLYLTGCCSFATGGLTPVTVTPPTSFRQWDPNKYDGTIQAWFEVGYSNYSGDAASISVVDRDGNVYATIILPDNTVAVGWSWGWYTRRVAITMPADVRDVGFSLTHAVGHASHIFIKSAWIRIRQTGATKSRVHIPLLSLGYEWGMAESVQAQYLGASIEVMTGGVYLPNFDDPSGTGWSWALDALPIIKLG